jgi:hypothetical protein
MYGCRTWVMPGPSPRREESAVLCFPQDGDGVDLVAAVGEAGLAPVQPGLQRQQEVVGLQA